MSVANYDTWKASNPADDEPEEDYMDKQTQTSEPNEPSSLKYDMPVFHRLAMSVLYDLEEYLDNRSDVIDGDYGQPKPNHEMTLLGDVRLAIRMGEKGK